MTSGGRSDDLRLGLVGVGRWGRNYVRTLASGAVPGASLAAIASRNPETASLAPEGVSLVPDWRSLLDAGLDGLIIATPPATHLELIEAVAVDAALPILVEKPIIGHQDDCDAAARLLDAATAPVMVGNTHVFSEPFQALRARRADRPGADPMRIEASAGGPGPFRPDVPVLWDWGAHDFAMLLALAPGDWTPVAATRRSRARPEGLEETIAVRLAGPAGAEAQLRLSNAVEKHRYFSVSQAGETLTYRDAGPARLTARDAHPGADPAETVLMAEATPPLTSVCAAFAQLVRGAPSALARESVALALAAARLMRAIDFTVDEPA